MRSFARPESELEPIAARLTSSGAMALVRVEFEPLRRIERRYGGKAYEQTMEGLAALVRELAGRVLTPEAVHVTPDRHSDAILAFLFRPRSDWSFYTANARKTAAEISAGLTRHGRRAVYPYHRDPLEPSVGVAVVLHDPDVLPARQILRAIAEAEGDARLEAGLRARRARQRLLQLLLCRDIHVRYEPIVDLRRDAAIYGHEALVRGPEGGDLRSPRQLFGQAEALGMLSEVDAMCRTKALENAHVLPPGTKLFVNCLPAGLGDHSLRSDGLRKSLEGFGLRPSDLVLEISENQSIHNFAIFREMRDACQDLGIEIAIDDAGTGYASLEAIVEVAPDFIKLDMGLVRGLDADPPRQQVVRAVHAVARGIGALVVAEGIETVGELEAVREIGIPLAQGFYFGPALSPESGSAPRGDAADASPRRTT